MLRFMIYLNRDISWQFANRNELRVDSGGWAQQTGYSIGVTCTLDFSAAIATAGPGNPLNQLLAGCSCWWTGPRATPRHLGCTATRLSGSWPMQQSCTWVSALTCMHLDQRKHWPRFSYLTVESFAKIQCKPTVIGLELASKLFSIQVSMDVVLIPFLTFGC